MHPLVDYVRQHAAALAKPMAARAATLGLRFTLPDGIRDIPLVGTPAIVSVKALAERQALSAQLTSAGTKAAAALLARPAGNILRAAFSPIEREVLEANGPRVDTLAIARVDFFVNAEGKPWALELNTTIPAMSAYSDIAAQAFIEALAGRFQLSAGEQADLLVQNGSNTRALYQALLQGYARATAGRHPERIAILCRRQDAQLTELQYVAARFREWGTDTEIVFPDELTLGETNVVARGRAFDLVFRHLFVRRLEEINASSVRALFRQRGPAVLLNPPSAQVEAKTTFALLSECGHDADLAAQVGLTEAERHAVKQCVPWTRAFVAGQASGPGSEVVSDLVSFVSAQPERFVLKRSWEYGGKAVFIGAEADTEGFRERVANAYGRALSWPATCAEAARDTRGGGFVVQERIVLPRQEQLLFSQEGVSTLPLYVDFSVYASLGVGQQPPWGGVCRGSSAQIVNIVGGGGVAPLLLEPVADALTAASRRHASKSV